MKFPLSSILAAGIPPTALIAVVVVVVLLFSLLLVFLARYRRCPSDKVMVIYGKVGQNKDGSARSAKCIHGGAAFIWPVVQAYEYLDLTPISISVDLKSALSRQNIRIDVPARFTVGISTEAGVMQNAAERLLGLRLQEIQELAKDIIFGQMRLIIATMQIEEINIDRDKFLEAVSRCVEAELKMLTLEVNSAGSDFVKLGELTAQQQDAEQRLEQLVERWAYLTELAEASGVF